MDDPECDLVKLRRTYAQFRVVNAVVAGWRRTYRDRLRPVLKRGEPNTLLDIGAGGGDVSRAIARWARRDGFDLRVTAADPDGRAHDWALARNATAGVETLQAFSSGLVAAGRTFDLVISNHLLHHLQDEERTRLIADCERLARVRVVHSDIHRSRLAYALFSVGATPFWGSYIRADGRRSIRRSFTAEELRALCPSGWRVLRQRPWRILWVHDTVNPVS